MRLRCAVERECGARTRAKLDTIGTARRACDVADVAANGFAHLHGAHFVAERGERARVVDRFERVGADRRRTVHTKDLVLLFLRGIAELDEEEETIELHLGQRERALELDGVLRRDDAERLGELMRRLVDRDLALLHRFEQARLRARRRAVDLIDEEEVRHDRSRPEFEALRSLVVDRDAGDVRRDKVRRALDAVERQ